MNTSGCEDALTYKPGTIKYMKLINFMCHGSFELPLGPNVNFIIGPNGSGKSALLTALTVALGARATNTARGKRASDFIKYGAKWARVIVVIHNYDKIMNKEQAFKPDDYGKTITVEKTLYKDEASKLALKNDKDKKVSERKQELDEMLEHFGIVVNNPICILNQEVSKTFLHSKKPEDKFELFMKATNLELIEQNYETAQQTHKEWNSCISRKNVAFNLLEKEYEACIEKTNFLMNRAKLQDLKDSLDAELMLAMERDIEIEGKQIEAKVLDLKKIIEEAKLETERRKEKIKKFEEEIQISRAKIQAIDANIEEARKKFSDIRSKELTVRTNQMEIDQKVTSLKRKISRNIDDKNSLEKSIEDKKKELKDQNDLDNDSEQRKLEVESLEREIPNDHAREKSIRSHTNQLSESMTSVRGELHAANMRVTDLKTKQSQHLAVLRRLKNGQDNSLRKYGDHMVKVLDEIARAHAAGRFKKKPVGPLGYYIKLKTPDVSGPLEIHLGKNAHAFACDNHQDMTTLNTIFKRFGSNYRDFRQPVIITRPFGSRHQVSRFRAHHHTYLTLLDHIEITEDAAYNALVDRTFLESVLFIPEYHLAESLMIDTNAVPKNTRMAYTKDCSTMFPRTARQGYRSFANRGGQRFLFSDSNTNQIRDLERELANLEADLRDAENIAKNIQLNLSVQRTEYEQNMQESRKLMTELRRKEEKLLNLKTTIAVQPEELSALENELENAINSIAADKLSVEKHMESLSLLQQDLIDVAKEKKEAQNIMRMHEEKRQDELKIVDGTKSSINDAQFKIRENNLVITNRKKDLEAEEMKLDKNLERLARAKQSIAEGTARPTEIRETEVVKAELNKIEKQIEVQSEDMQDPEEMMRNIKKRMKEIENLTSLKDWNLKNFATCTKTLSQRKEGFATLRSNTIAAVSATFATVMRTMKMNGVLQIHLDDVTHLGETVKKARTLEMRIDTNYTPSQRVNLVMGESDSNNNTSHLNRRTSRSQPTSVTNNPATVAPSRPKRSRVDANGNDNSTQMAEKENEVKMTDCRSLSGGERSFSTVAFVLALWHHCTSPFKLMDEIDVFMDMVTRRVSYNALIRFAQVSENPGQFIFFSPLELPKIDNSGAFVRVFEMPIIVRKRPHSQMNGGGDEPQLDND